MALSQSLMACHVSTAGKLPPAVAALRSTLSSSNESSGKLLFRERRAALLLSQEGIFSGRMLTRPRSISRQAPVVRAQAESSATSSTATATSAPPPSSPMKQESDVRVLRLLDGIFTLRGRSSERLKFEVEYGLKVGTTENTYVIEGEEGTAIIDLPDQAFAAAFAKALKEATDPGRIRFLVLGHLSPKRVESVVQLAALHPDDAPPIEVFCSNPAAQMLTSSLPEGLLDSALSLRVVKPGDTLDLGGGRVLRFILTPTPRWPDGLVTYDASSQLIFTHKLFSAHICSESDFDVGGWEVYGEHWRFFYDCMLAPVAQQVESALDKLPIVAQFAAPSYEGKRGIDVVKADIGLIWNSLLSALNLDLARSTSLSFRPASSSSSSSSSSSPLVAAAICPLHGPIVRSSLTELAREYKQWTAEKIKAAEEATVAVFFASAYGNTSALAQALSRGLLRAGVGVRTVNCEISTKEEIQDAIRTCEGFVVGSPTLGGHMPTPVQEALGLILQDSSARKKPAGVFGSFGWSGEAVDEIEQRLRDGGFSFAFPAIRCKFKPTEGMLQICEESGRDLAKEVRKAKARQRAQESKPAPLTAAASSAEQAVGRVVGSLCVVSAKNGDAESAMLASWVSQASFTPPGLTIAVAKDRAVESLVLPGGAFAVSVLGEGKVGPVSKQLLKNFKPGESRFGSLATKEAKNGATVLADAIAYLECTVQSRMETGDHWVLYATVDDGNLQDDKTLTALHHRKIGSRY